ncbi:MAG: glycosyltransferase [Deltaproteobacteria bacterium]|nr:glycosyltransferase [Deltaproteobacteria bacterium]MBT4088119.1 glycosyltransferase [Deltaproteobacteria bacterium]MBT4268144.1 glycosyltransferase [Deltaproteobacteria bacterium]MBT4640227.1 glycosyltransferase [Deltaproteobacteria bacterium]MBT6614767.1 glycosyltransferase [Deltaproteobacteria bacterium]
MVSKTQTIHIYLLTYNRPQYFLQALHSVLNQNFEDFLVIVSDNSTNDETEKLVQTIHHPKLQYIKRTPSTPSLEHYRTVLSEVSSEYFMIFHDDDIMDPDCLSILSSDLDASPTAAAVGGNAEIFWDTKNRFKRRFFKPAKQNRVLQHPNELAKIYLTFEGLAPFPSYMYRKSLINGLNLDPEEGGQGADVSFLLKVLQRGEIIWENRCIMQYRKHHSQDSQGLDIKDLLQLLNHIHKNTDVSRKSFESNFFRYKSWAGVLKSQFFQTGGKLTDNRMKMIYRAIFCFSPFDIFLKLFIWRIRAIIAGVKSR